MAQRVVTLLEDDFDGSKASETLSFALDGVDYAIDLNDAHARELREAFSRYTKAARKTGGRSRTTRPASSNARESDFGRPNKACQSIPAAVSRLTSWKSTKPRTERQTPQTPSSTPLIAPGPSTESHLSIDLETHPRPEVVRLLVSDC